MQGSGFWKNTTGVVSGRTESLYGSAVRACELLPVLFEREIVDAHQCMFAMGESIAHLNYLEKQQKLKRLERDGVIRFVTA